MKAIYAGSFDPPTKGHVDLILKASKMFEQLFVVVAFNSTKKRMFSIKDSRDLIKQSLIESGNTRSNITIVLLEEKMLLVNLADTLGASYMVRSMRTITDFEYELTTAHHNKMQAPHIETIFIPTGCEMEKISSTFVREIFMLKGKISYMVFPCVEKALEKFS